MTENVKNLISWLNENQWLNLIFLILAVLSIAVSVYIFFKSKKKKNPIYLIKTFNLLRDRVSKIEELKIAYDDKAIKNFSITKVAFWNRGNEVINRTDISAKEPIRLEVSDEFDILNSSITYVKNDANNISIQIASDKKSVVIDFDYLFTNEGVSFEIYHTGLSGKNIKFKGCLKDIPKFPSADYNKDFIIDYIFDKTFGLLRPKLSDMGWKIYFICILPILLPVYIIASPIQSLHALTRKTSIPNEYTLEDEE